MWGKTNSQTGISKQFIGYPTNPKSPNFAQQIPEFAQVGLVILLKSSASVCLECSLMGNGTGLLERSLGFGSWTRMCQTQRAVLLSTNLLFIKLMECLWDYHTYNDRSCDTMDDWFFPFGYPCLRQPSLEYLERQGCSYMSKL